MLVTVQLTSTFVFNSYLLNPKFQASSHLLWLYISVCVGLGWKPEDRFSLSYEPPHEKTGFLHMRKQRLCFAVSAPLFSLHRQYNPSTFLFRNFKPLAIFYGCTARFVLDQVKNTEDRLSQ